ncbi:MAG TPA: histidine kinase dimerization/phospho-acceptor domain-containing protein [Nannocystaceae bacterium]|nr:histidine kinase dimerization/phospho-acceptor domain-containing protein [Nannocystaceae bacterium]
MSEPYDARHDPSSTDHSGVLPSESLVAGRTPSALAHCGRLRVELQLLGVLGLAWLLACVHAWVWLRATADESAPIDGMLIGRLAVPQFVALAIVAMRTLVELPAARWDRTGSFATNRFPWAFAAIGWVLAPIAIVMVARDRTARAQRWSDDAVQAAHARLLRLPSATALRMLAWAAVAFAVDVMVLAAEREVAGVGALATVWIGAVGPCAVILLGAFRAVLRPEVLTVPIAAPPRRVFDLGMRLQLQLIVAGVGATAALASSAVSWSAAEHQHRAVERAAALADRVAELVRRGADEQLERMLARATDITVDDGRRRLGRARPITFEGDGPIDEDNDGRADLFVLREGTLAVVVPMPSTAPLDTTPMIVVGALAAVVLIAASLALARDAHRDVLRATAQVTAVADGRAPPPLGMHSLATRELRRLVRSVDRLVARTTESNVEKYVAIEKAKEADRLKSQFLANMSHDLRSPLNSVLGFSELLLSGIDGPLVAEQREIVETIHVSGRELLQQIDDILDTAKIDAGRLELHPEPNPVATLVTRAVQNAQRRAPAFVSYGVDAEAGLPPAFVDPYRTVQALENVLVFAAVKLESTGSSEITVRMRLAMSGRRRVIAVEVRTPVAPASAAQLAEARRGFHRIPGHRGLGLQLPIAGSILELQGGSLSIRESRNGMVFRIELRSLELRRTTGPHRSTSA